MCNTGDFIIENGILEKYKDPGGNVDIPDGVTAIGDRAFSRSYAPVPITIPARAPGNAPDSNCDNLTSVILPDGVIVIGNRAFRGCSNLLSIRIPSSVMTIGENAFLGCEMLTIYGPASGYAEAYAAEYNFPFIEE